MKCPHCGSAMPDGAKTCPDCGREIAQEGPSITWRHADGSRSKDVPAELAAKPGKEHPAYKFSRIVILICSIVYLLFSFVRLARSCESLRSGNDDASTSTTSQAHVSATDVDAPLYNSSHDERLDSFGNFKAKNLVYYSGPVLASLFDELGFQLEGASGDTYWVNEGRTCALAILAYEDEQPLDTESLKSHQVGGGGRATQFVLTVSGYDDVEAALEGCGLHFDELTIMDDGLACGIASGSNAKFFVVGLADEGSGTITIRMFNRWSIEAGALSDYGTTIKDVYESFRSS